MLRAAEGKERWRLSLKNEVELFRRSRSLKNFRTTGSGIPSSSATSARTSRPAEPLSEKSPALQYQYDNRIRSCIHPAPPKP